VKFKKKKNISRYLNPIELKALQEIEMIGSAHAWIFFVVLTFR
jgi:hypothetical protein